MTFHVFLHAATDEHVAPVEHVESSESVEYHVEEHEYPATEIHLLMDLSIVEQEHALADQL